jgi:membrane protein DedA with SNARE-associated domain
MLRCIPLIRSIISIPAARAAVPRLQFLAGTVIGDTVWAIVWISVGYALGPHFEEWTLTISGVIALIALTLLVLSIISEIVPNVVGGWWRLSS